VVGEEVEEEEAARERAREAERELSERQETPASTAVTTTSNKHAECAVLAQGTPATIQGSSPLQHHQHPAVAESSDAGVCPQDPRDAEENVVILMCEGTSVVSNESEGGGKEGGEGELKKNAYIPTCPHGRALELLLLESGIKYHRYVVDPERIEPWWLEVSEKHLSPVQHLLNEDGDTKMVLPLPALRYWGEWLTPAPHFRVDKSNNVFTPTDVVDHVIRAARRVEERQRKQQEIMGQQEEETDSSSSSSSSSVLRQPLLMPDLTPTSVLRASTGNILATVGWRYVCSGVNTREEKDAMKGECYGLF
jgi:hypothetical protein